MVYKVHGIFLHYGLVAPYRGVPQSAQLAHGRHDAKFRVTG